MSNYTAKRRAGGGLLVSTQLASMISVTFLALDNLEVTYSNPVGVGSLNNGDFHTLPDNRVPTGINYPNPTTIELSFNEDVDDQTDLTYDGQSSGVEHPQTIAITP